ncbi:hypothetical protein [Pectobacterium phage PcaP2EGY]
MDYVDQFKAFCLVQKYKKLSRIPDYKWEESYELTKEIKSLENELWESKITIEEDD